MVISKKQSNYQKQIRNKPRWLMIFPLLLQWFISFCRSDLIIEWNCGKSKAPVLTEIENFCTLPWKTDWQRKINEQNSCSFLSSEKNWTLSGWLRLEERDCGRRSYSRISGPIPRVEHPLTILRKKSIWNLCVPNGLVCSDRPHCWTSKTKQ